MSGTHTQGREIKSEHSLSHTTGEAEWPLGRLSGHLEAKWLLGRLSGHRGDQVATGETKWLLGRLSGHWRDQVGTGEAE